MFCVSSSEAFGDVLTLCHRRCYRRYVFFSFIISYLSRPKDERHKSHSRARATATDTHSKCLHFRVATFFLFPIPTQHKRNEVMFHAPQRNETMKNWRKMIFSVSSSLRGLLLHHLFRLPLREHYHSAFFLSGYWDFLYAFNDDGRRILDNNFESITATHRGITWNLFLKDVSCRMGQRDYHILAVQFFWQAPRQKYV